MMIPAPAMWGDAFGAPSLRTASMQGFDPARSGAGAITIIAHRKSPALGSGLQPGIYLASGIHRRGCQTPGRHHAWLGKPGGLGGGKCPARRGYLSRRKPSVSVLDP